MNWEIGTDIYTLPCIKQIASGKLLYNHREFNSVFCDDLERWDGGRRELQEGGDICVHIADSLCCITVTNTMWYSNDTPN